jgi:hypothetical protein
MLTGVEDAMLVTHSHKSLVDCGLHKIRVDFKEGDGAKLELLRGVYDGARPGCLLDAPNEESLLGGWEGLIC